VGAKTSVLVYADGDAPGLPRDAPERDVEKTVSLIRRLYPGWNGDTVADAPLVDELRPEQGVVYAGCFPGVDIICDRKVMIERPSELPRHLLEASPHRRVILHAMNSVVDWFAYAIWEDGTLTRSLSLSPEQGVIENIGDPLPFETAYWAGEHPVRQREGWPPYALPFHPLELGGGPALQALLGFCIEGTPLASDIDAEAIRLSGFRVPVTDSITQADVEAFTKTHRLTRHTFGPDGSLIPLENS
jgi:hypothetical protein